MLLQFRNITRGWIATIIVLLVGGATVLFLIPNSGVDLGGSAYLAKVGDERIAPRQLTRELELTLRAQRAEGQQNLSSQDAIDAGLHLRLLEGMINRLAMYWYGDKIGVSASDAQVAARIREIPATRNAVTGEFDATAYANFLQQLNYGRSEFEADVRGDLTTQMIMEALAAGVRAPASYGALAYTFEAEQRVVSIAEAPASAVGVVPQPNEAQLQAFYEDNQAQLQVPEFRALTLVYARPSDFVARVNIPESRLREEFDARVASLTQPERRTFVRIAAANETQANDAAARLNRGESAASIATAMNLQSTRGENQSRAEVPDRAVADAVFSAQVRGPAVVARGSLSPFVVVKVESSTPAVTPSFAQYRQQIHDAIAADEARALLDTAVAAFEDARGGGASATEAARAANLPAVTIPAVEAGGRDQRGQPLEALAGHEDVLAAAFETPEGEATDFTPAGDADVVAAVDRITPATVRPLEEVRTELAAAWMAQERARRLRELGDTITAAVNSGQTLAAAARANRANIVITSRPVDRRGASQLPSQGMPAQIFAAREGQAVSGVRNDGGAVIVAVVEHINRPDVAANPQIVEAARAQMQQNFGQTLGEALQGEIVERARPRRNERLIANTYRASNAESEEGQ
jgi:peptidyl-prolyl cis-trans isomerase D